jgi:hypothetical protein
MSSPDDGYNRDPGASVEEAGLPEVADDERPTGDVPEPQIPATPTDAPSYGLFRVEEQETLDERLAEEEPDPTQDPDLFDDQDEDPVADLPEPEEELTDPDDASFEAGLDPDAALHVETEPEQ